ncbi:MAG TPA: hypothetical protein VI431_02585 [Candidatus Acidoferrum sp.]
MSRIYLGRNVYGLAAILFGVLTFVWRGVNAWREILPLGKVPHPEVLLYIAGVIQLFGGVAIQWPLTKRIGAFSLGGIYFIFALLTVPQIVGGPLTYNNWGNFFEQFSLVAGALVAYGTTGPNTHGGAPRLARLGYISFGVCAVSFALEQLAYLSATAMLVPKWIPPGQLFWAIATTIAFGLAAVALLSGRSALLAARLLTIMLVGFGFLVWLPIVVSDPHKLFHWTESAETLAIAGAAWIVADFLSQRRSEAP